MSTLSLINYVTSNNWQTNNLDLHVHDAGDGDIMASGDAAPRADKFPMCNGAPSLVSEVLLMLNTERPSCEHTQLDQYSIIDLVNAFVDDQVNAVSAVRAASGQIAAAVTAAVPRITAGGRLIYVGAGTSGRLGLLDSVELYPTFSWPKERAVALLAGGQEAMYQAVEGAEDSRDQGAADILAAKVGKHDTVLLVAASGTTPYVMGALHAARDCGALTIGMANNPQAPVVKEAEIGITLDTGAEVISGSTRLKAGTAQKIALNTISSAVMVRLHKVYGNLMVDMRPTNAKLQRRAVHLTMHATGADEEAARRTLKDGKFQVKVAIVALSKQITTIEAELLLAEVGGSVRLAIAESERAGDGNASKVPIAPARSLRRAAK